MSRREQGAIMAALAAGFPNISFKEAEKAAAKMVKELEANGFTVTERRPGA